MRHAQRLVRDHATTCGAPVAVDEDGSAFPRYYAPGATAGAIVIWPPMPCPRQKSNSGRQLTKED